MEQPRGPKLYFVHFLLQKYSKTMCKLAYAFRGRKITPGCKHIRFNWTLRQNGRTCVCLFV